MNERQEAARAAEAHRARVAQQQQRHHAEGVRRLGELDQSSAAGAFIRAMHDPKRRGGHSAASNTVLDNDAHRRDVEGLAQDVMAYMYPDSDQSFTSTADAVRQLAAFHAVPVPPQLRADFGDTAAPDEPAAPQRDASASASVDRNTSLGPVERAQQRLATWIEHHYGLRLHRSAALRRLLSAGAPVTPADIDSARSTLRGHRPGAARRRRAPGSSSPPPGPDADAKASAGPSTGQKNAPSVKEEPAPGPGREPERGEAAAGDEDAPPTKRARRDSSDARRRAAACGANPLSVGRLSRAAQALCEAASAPPPPPLASLVGTAPAEHSVGGVPCNRPARDYEEAEVRLAATAVAAAEGEADKLRAQVAALRGGGAYREHLPALVHASARYRQHVKGLTHAEHTMWRNFAFAGSGANGGRRGGHQ